MAFLKKYTWTGYDAVVLSKVLYALRGRDTYISQVRKEQDCTNTQVTVIKQVVKVI